MSAAALPSSPERLRAWPAGLALAFSLGVYAATLCPSVYAEGSGELIGATCLLGTPHPPGYPLYCLLGRILCAASPWGTPALQVNAFTALTSALAAAALTAFLQARGLHPWTALGGGLMWAFSATFWSQAVIAEVYGLAMVAAVLVLWGGSEPVAAPRRQLALGLLLGMGALAHLQVALLAPAALFLALAVDARPRSPGAVRRLAVAAARLAIGGVAGLSPSLYLLLRSGRGSGFHWSRVDGLAELWAHASAALYRGSFLSLPLDGVLLNGERWLRLAAGELHPLLVPAVVWGAWRGARRDPRLFGQLAAALALNLATALQYHRDPANPGVFHLISFLTLTASAAWGLDDLGRRAARAGARGWGLAAAGVGPALLVGWVHWDAADRSDVHLPRQYGLDLLASLPPRAVLLTEGDEASYLVDYLWRVEGVRRDVSLYNRQGRGTDLVAGPAPWPSGEARWREQMRRERVLISEGARPVCYAAARAMPAAGFGFAPVGLVYRAVPLDSLALAALPLADSVLGRSRGPTPDAWTRRLAAAYWFMHGEYLTATGDGNGADGAYSAAADLASDSRTTQFNAAVICLRHNQLERALERARAAVDLDPYNPSSLALAAEILRRLDRVAEAEEMHARARDLERLP